MKDILNEIIAHKRVEVARHKKELPASKLFPRVETELYGKLWHRSMRDALATSPHGIIAEFKRKSPSKGWINAEADPVNVVPSYVSNGAAAVSILADEEYFGGSMEHIRQVRPLVDVPILCKDFIIDDYQIYQAKDVGADAVLIIARTVPLKQCRELVRTARDLHIETLLEIHNRKDFDYLDCGPTMVGVNNRNLGTFHTDVMNSYRIAPLLPERVFKVSESGIRDPDVIRFLREFGFKGFLLGESLMQEENPGEALAKVVEGVRP